MIQFLYVLFSFLLGSMLFSFIVFALCMIQLHCSYFIIISYFWIMIMLSRVAFIQYMFRERARVRNFSMELIGWCLLFRWIFSPHFALEVWLCFRLACCLPCWQHSTSVDGPVVMVLTLVSFSWPQLSAAEWTVPPFIRVQHSVCNPT